MYTKKVAELNEVKRLLQTKESKLVKTVEENEESGKVVQLVKGELRQLQVI